MAALLDDKAIEDALAALRGWRRVDNTLVKDVPIDDDAAGELETAVATAADELDHHPVVERSTGTMRFTLWSHSDGGITGKDIALATRIDEATAATGPAA